MRLEGTDTIYMMSKLGISLAYFGYRHVLTSLEVSRRSGIETTSKRGTGCSGGGVEGRVFVLASKGAKGRQLSVTRLAGEYL